MKKRLHLKNLKNHFRDSSPINKRLLASVLTALLLFVSIQMQAQSQKKINLTLHDVSLKEAIKTIEVQTGYAFFYNNENIDLDQKISIDVKNTSIDKIMLQLFPNYTYRLEKEKVVILPATKTNKDSSKTVKGKIVDETGEPIIGASILIKGTTTGTITDIDGNFSLPSQNGDIMLISYIGYLDKQIKVTNDIDYSILLEEDNKMLEEVVVVGYGVEKKVNVIGSIAHIDSKKLENRSTPQLSNALAGQMSGVTVIQRSGQPGASGAEIRIRGEGSFDQEKGSSPKALVLIDGIEGDMNDVSTEDVESISVLKDASTAAIYGARAANGVILITTKTGKEGKISVGYGGYIGFNKATELPEFVDSWEWADMYNKAKGGSPTYSAADIQMMKDGSNPDKFGNVHYLNELLDHTGFQTGHDLTLNGGDKKNKYMVSLGYLSQDGIIEKNNYSRYNTRVNLINDLASNLQLTTRLSGIYSNVREPGETGGDDAEGMMGLVQQAVRMPAPFPAILTDGTFGAGPAQRGTPISALKSASFFKSPKYVIDANMRLDYQPIKGLNLSAIGAYKYTNKEEKKFRSTQILDGGRVLGPSTIRNMMAKERYKSFQGLADYSLSIDKNNFGLLVGYSWEDRDYREFSAFRDNLASNDKPEISVGSLNNQQNESKGWDWAMQSVFGRFKYNYNERYLFESTMRYDGSSRFPEDRKYAFFPSLAAGWRISEESFMKENSDLNWISNLKLKTSWGRLGNENITDYQSKILYSVGHYYPFGGKVQQGLAVKEGRASIKWEETETIDVGIEAILWNGLLSANVSYYYRKTTDILTPPSTVSAVWGLTPTVRNTGELRNTGWEIELGHRNKIGDVNYNIGVNMSTVKNEVLTLGPGADVQQLNGMIGNGNSLFVGHPIKMYYGYKTDGVFLDQADIDSWYDQTAINPNPKPGDIRYLPIDPNDTTVDPKKDRQYLGSRVPKFTYGISLGAEYKGFDLSVLIQGVSGVKGRLEDYAGFAFRSDVGNAQRWQAEGAFDPEKPTRYPAYPRLETLSNIDGANTYVSDFWIKNASYVRLKNVQFGYTFPTKLLRNIKIANARLYVQAENPLTFHNYPEGWDPEINTGGKYYPILKTYTFGVNLKF